MHRYSIVLVCALLILSSMLFFLGSKLWKQESNLTLKSAYNRGQVVKNEVVIDGADAGFVTGFVVGKISIQNGIATLSIKTQIEGVENTLSFPITGNRVSTQLVSNGQLNPDSQTWTLLKIESVNEYLYDGMQIVVDIVPQSGELSLKTLNNARVKRITIPTNK